MAAAAAAPTPPSAPNAPNAHHLQDNHLVDEIEYLLDSACRVAAIVEAATERLHPDLKRRRPGAAADVERFRVTTAKWDDTALTLTLLLRSGGGGTPATPRTPVRSVEIGVLISASAADPPFCFASNTLAAHAARSVDEVLGAAVAAEINAAVFRRAAGSQVLSLLELVALAEVTSTSRAASIPWNVAAVVPSAADRTDTAGEDALWRQLSTQGHACRMMLAVLAIADGNLRRATLCDPNPFLDNGLAQPVARLSAMLKRLLAGGAGIRRPTSVLPAKRADVAAMRQSGGWNDDDDDNINDGEAVYAFLKWCFCGGARTTLRTGRSTATDPSDDADAGESNSSSSVSSSSPSSSSSSPAPTWSFDVVHRSQSPRFESMKRAKGVVRAYHGTDAHNVWSCLQNGLLSMSGTRLESNGAVFGDGVYLATALEVSMCFAPRFMVPPRIGQLFAGTGAGAAAGACAPPKPLVAGRGLMFVFECDVVDEPRYRLENPGPRGATALVGGVNANPAPRKETYLVVDDPKMIRVRRLLVFEAEGEMRKRYTDVHRGVAMLRKRRLRGGGEQVDSGGGGDASGEGGGGEGGGGGGGGGGNAAVGAPPPAVLGGSATENTAPPSGPDRSNGDDVKSRMICCTVVTVLWLCVFAATMLMQKRRYSQYQL